MDEKELEEGLTWEELLRVLNEKKRSDRQVDSDTATWIDLLLLLDSERSFFSLRKGPDRKISAEKENSSKKVLDCFFEKAWQSPILKSRSSKADEISL